MQQDNSSRQNDRAEVEIILPGRPITKKNSQRIFRRGGGSKGAPFVVPSKQYKAFEEEALYRLNGYHGPAFDGPVHMCAEYWMPNRASWPDLMGLLQATADVLEKAGVIDDDQLIKSLDGTRIVGVDKEAPRTVVTLREIEYEIEEAT